MTNWLPDEEGAQLRFEFDAELARLKAGPDSACSWPRRILAFRMSFLIEQIMKQLELRAPLSRKDWRERFEQWPQHERN